MTTGKDPGLQSELARGGRLRSIKGRRVQSVFPSHQGSASRAKQRQPQQHEAPKTGIPNTANPPGGTGIEYRLDAAPTNLGVSAPVGGDRQFFPAAETPRNFYSQGFDWSGAPSDLERSIKDNFDTTLKAGVGGNLPQDNGIRLFVPDYLKLGNLLKFEDYLLQKYGNVFNRMHGEHREAEQQLYTQFKAATTKKISEIFKRNTGATSRTNLVRLVTELVGYDMEFRREHNMSLFYNFSMPISNALLEVVRRASDQASEITRWGLVVPAHERDQRLIEKMSDIYKVTWLFGTKFSDGFKDEFKILYENYLKTVKTSIREAAQSSFDDPNRVMAAGIQMIEFVFSSGLDFNVRATIRSENVKATPR